MPTSNDELDLNPKADAADDANPTPAEADAVPSLFD